MDEIRVSLGDKHATVTFLVPETVLTPSLPLILVLLQGCRAAWGAPGIAVKRGGSPGGRTTGGQPPSSAGPGPAWGRVCAASSDRYFSAGGLTGRAPLRQETQRQVPEGLVVAWLQVCTRIPSIVPAAAHSSRHHITARGFRPLRRTRAPLPSSLSSGPGRCPTPGPRSALMLDPLPLTSGRAEPAHSHRGTATCRTKSPSGGRKAPAWGT